MGVSFRRGRNLREQHKGGKMEHMVTELDDGKIYRKPLYLMVKHMVSCRFSLKPIHWYGCLGEYFSKKQFASALLWCSLRRWSCRINKRDDCLQLIGHWKLLLSEHKLFSLIHYVWTWCLTCVKITFQNWKRSCLNFWNLCYVPFGLSCCTYSTLRSHCFFYFVATNQFQICVDVCYVPIFVFFENCCLYWLQTYFSPSHTISLAFKILVGISAMDCGNLQGHWCAEHRRMCRLRRALARRFVALAGWAQGRGRGTLQGEFQWISATKHGGVQLKLGEAKYLLVLCWGFIFFTIVFWIFLGFF